MFLLNIVNMSIPPNDFLSIKEFAYRLKVHPNTIRNAIRRGRISAFRIGTAKKSPYRIASSELNRMALFDMEEMIERIIEKRKGLEENSLVG